jgi:hypothetical protein
VSVPCNSCGSPIVWATTDNGKAMPVDASPPADRKGNVQLYTMLDGKLGAHVLSTPTVLVGELHKSHFATCEFAAQHRKARKVGG